jgi:hypothetical protein
LRQWGQQVNGTYESKSGASASLGPLGGGYGYVSVGKNNRPTYSELSIGPLQFQNSNDGAWSNSEPYELFSLKLGFIIGIEINVNVNANTNVIILAPPSKYEVSESTQGPPIFYMSPK